VYKGRHREVRMKEMKKRIVERSGLLRKPGMVVLLMGCLFFFSGIMSAQEQVKDDVEALNSFKKSEIHFEKGEQLLKKEKDTKAEKSLKKCIEIFPQHAQAHYYLSKIFYKKNNLQEALTYISKARQYYKVYVMMNRLEKQKKLEELNESMRGIRKELEFQDWGGRRDELRRGLVEAQKKVKGLRENLKAYLLSANITLGDYHYFHGNIYFKLKKYQDANNQYVEAIKLNPKHGDAYNNLAILFFMIKDYDKALDYLNQAESNGGNVNPKFKEAVLKAIQEK
jgi:tetratricopeptide (TPR) repeat protein